MQEQTSKELAKILRPFLCEMAEQFELGKGILGIVIRIPEIRKDVYFAEFVGSIRAPTEINDDELLQHHYVLKHSNILSICLWGKRQAHAFLPKDHALATDEEIHGPITLLFQGEESIPEKIKIYYNTPQKLGA